MAVDYDLVILGGTMLARSIAAQACRFQAQVALVEPRSPHNSEQFRLLLRQRAKAILQAKQLPLVSVSDLPAAEILSLAAQTAPLLGEVVLIQQQQSLDQLAAAGVDVIAAEGAFLQQRHLGFQVSGRLLRSRAYLLALPGIPQIPPTPGLAEIPFLTLDDLTRWQPEKLPDRIAIWGDDPQGIELSQTLQRLGIQIVLLQSRFLPQFDPQAAQYLQAQLEAEGVELFTGVSVDRVENAPAGIRLCASDANGRTHIAEANLLLLATSRQPHLASINLEAIGIRSAAGIRVNHRLQTSHPRVYACGETLGGFTQPQLARYEADLVLHNALFLPPRRVASQLVPWMLFTDPQVAQVGMSEAIARKAYGKEVQTLTASIATIPAAHATGMNGYCSLILRRGRILGATIVSPQAGEWVSILTLAIQQNLSVNQLAQLSIPSPTFAELLDRLIHRWQHERFTAAQRTWLDRYFDFRRSWSS